MLLFSEKVQNMDILLQVKGQKIYQNGQNRSSRIESVWFKVVQFFQVFIFSNSTLLCCHVTGARCGHALIDSGESLVLIGGHQKLYNGDRFSFKQMSGVFSYNTNTNLW